MIKVDKCKKHQSTFSMLKFNEGDDKKWEDQVELTIQRERQRKKKN